MNRVVVGLGTNLGDRTRNLRVALRLLEREDRAIRVVGMSRAYESEAMLPADAPPDGAWNLPFHNMAALVETPLAPERLLAVLKEIEREMGRENRARWAPRVIDLDLLAWQGLSIETRELRLPHPGLTERPFALLPAAEVAPAWHHTGLGPNAGRRLDEIARAWRSGAMPYGTRVLEDGHPSMPEIMGVVNVTPDSFSDGGLYASPEKALAQVRALIDAGASIVDIGAESTRPGARPLSAEDELARLAPVLEKLRKGEESDSVSLSFDTRHAATARWVLERMAEPGRSRSLWINDVAGFAEPRMREAVASSDCELVVMHSLTVPASREMTLPEGADPIAELMSWWRAHEKELVAAGVARDRLIFDPGIGFGKTPAQSLEILHRIDELRGLGVRLLVGHSRKSFLGLFTRREFAERDIETLAASLHLASRRVDYLRVHDVASHARALKVFHALRSPLP